MPTMTATMTPKMMPTLDGRHGRQHRPKSEFRTRAALCVMAMVLAAGASAAPCAAQPSGGGICIDPDIEFPVPCDEDED